MRKYAGGSLSTTTTYKPASVLNQMLGWRNGETNAVYTYDANGNRQDKFIIIDGENDATNYEYDEDNRLTQVTLRDTEKPKEYTFAYDYRTRRISRETPTEKTLHVFDGGLSVQEYLVEATPSSLTLDNLTTESIRGEGMGGGVGGMVYSVRNGQIEASHSNHRGDVTARTDNLGNISWFARYNAYGTRFDEVGATHDRQRGNTKDEEEDLGARNQGHRWDDIVHGVWLTPDPIGYDDGPNRYLYVHCNPITGYDPLGLRDATAQEMEAQFAGGGRRNTADYQFSGVNPWVSAGAEIIADLTIPYAGATLDTKDVISGSVDFKNGHPVSGAIQVAASIVGYVPVLGAIKVPIVRAAKAMRKGGDTVAKEMTQSATKNRVRLRKSTKEQIKTNQPRNSAGEMIDPNTKKPLKPDEIDTGHKSGQEWRKRKEMHEGKGSTRKEVLDAENNADLYQLEDRSSNRSHKHEEK